MQFRVKDNRTRQRTAPSKVSGLSFKLKKIDLPQQQHHSYISLYIYIAKVG